MPVARGSAGLSALLLCVALLAAACATEPEEVETISWSPTWFQCDDGFDCVAVFDAYCKYTAVNRRYALIYQDWARQQLVRLDELLPCDAPAEQQPEAAYCRNKRCARP